MSRGIQLRSRYIMYPIAAFHNDRTDFLESVLGGVIGLERAARPKSRTKDGEDNRAKKKLVCRIERAVDKDVAVPSCHQPLRRSPTIDVIASRICFEEKCFGRTVLRRILTPSLVLPATR